jgi:hypothetical protein
MSEHPQLREAIRFAERRANLLTELEQVGAMACMMTNAVNAQWPIDPPLAQEERT